MQIVRCRIGPLCYLSSNVPLVGKQKLKNCPELGPLTSTFMLSSANVKSCVILCRYVWPCTVSVDYLSGFNRPTTVLCRSLVTVTVASSAPIAKASWVVVMYTMNSPILTESLTTDLQSSVSKLFTS